MSSQHAVSSTFVQGKGVLSDFLTIHDRFGSTALEKRDGSDLMRVEVDPDHCLESLISKQDVLCKIQEIRDIQSSYDCADLYPRHWTRPANQSELALDLVDSGRQLHTFSVAQFNALAEGLCASADAKRTTPFPFLKENRSSKDKIGYGGFYSVPNPDISLHFDNRKWRLLEVLVGQEGTTPFDIIGMEEVDRFYGFFAPIMKLFGYDGIYLPKRQSPCISLGWYSDGCCLFWKRDLFDLIQYKRHDYGVGSQLALVATLQHKAASTPVVVAVTHLKSKVGDTMERIRCQQVMELLSAVDSGLGLVQDVSILIMGDFNAEPPCSVDSCEKSAVGLVLNNQGVHYRSAYSIEEESDMSYTTWKMRDDKETKRIIDYIFYGGNLRCNSTLTIPVELESSKLPGLRHPSDHLHIAAQFEIHGPVQTKFPR